jgi:hypothetical protein
MSASSIVPSTLEWEARICSMSVEPERGRPTMKMGAAASAAEARSRGEELRRAHRLLQPCIALGESRPVAALGLLQRIAPLVVSEGCGVLRAVLERLAERKAQVVAIGGLRGRGHLRVESPLPLAQAESIKYINVQQH